MDREKIKRLLRAQINLTGHIIGVSVGSGMTAKIAAMGGADILLALSAGKYRIMGRSSFSSYFCYGNNNEQVMNPGKREIFPTVALIDGKFREALEEEGTTFDREVAAIKLAKHFNLFTMAFVTNENETRQMIEAGADVICVHLGLTKGGFLGAKKHISIDAARKIAEKIFSVCRKFNPEVLRMFYAGPANTLVDMRYLYTGTNCQGYIGGSIFETGQSFKRYEDPSKKNPLNKLIDRQNTESPVEFIRKYVEENYRRQGRIFRLCSC